jgi:hypothetical protein
LIAIIVCSVLVAVLIVGLAVFFLVKKNRKNEESV